jgi:hypothetical protein
MALNLAQALGILVQSAQCHLNGELLTSDADKALLKESIDLLTDTEKKLEQEKNEKTDESGNEPKDGPLPDPAI